MIRIEISSSSSAYIIERLKRAGVRVDAETWDAIKAILERAGGLWLEGYFESLLVPTKIKDLLQIEKEGDHDGR